MKQPVIHCQADAELQNQPDRYAGNTMANFHPLKGKEDGIYIAPLSTHAYSQSARAWITQFYLQMTPCLPFLRKRSPDGATTTEAVDIQLQLTTHLSTTKG